MSQAICVAIGLAATLLTAFGSIKDGSLAVGDFVIFNTYIMQIYYPLGFLGTFWRFIRQAWTDVELVLDILTID
jgi:ABC-type transport system involved in Fe-S cluster assembly fused permease/ATPase subunit